MSDKVNKADDMDELSLLLDELNAGRKPECDDQELAELLTVADLVKKSGGPVCPPPHILEQTVDRAAAGIEAGKPKKSRFKAWLFSGTMGTAAAVILVFGLNMLPSWQERVAVVPPPAAVTQQKDAAPAKETPAERPSVTEVPATAVPAPSQQTPVGEPPKAAGPVVPAPPADSLQPPTVKSEKPSIAEVAPRAGQTKSIPISEEAKQPVPAIAPLKLPGKAPDLVVIDRESGIVKQVFYKGTSQEVTITQRLHPAEASNNQAKASSPGNYKATYTDQEPINQVIVTINNQEVTVEGHQSKQELQKLAESLKY